MRRFAAFATLVAANVFLAGCAASTRPARVGFNSQSNQVAVPIRIHDRTLTFLVDTAVDPSVVDRKIASDLGLKRLGQSGSIEGVGNESTTAYPVKIPEFRIAGQRFGPVDALVLDMSRISAAFGGRLDGVLGYSLLKDHAVLIDYPRNEVFVYRGIPPNVPKGCRRSHRFPLRFRSEEDRLILVPGLLINGVEVPAMLDTGSSNGLRIEEDAPALAGVRAVLPTGVAGSSVGARGQAVQRRGVLTVPVLLGPFRLAQTDVALVSLRNPDVPVNIGNRFLRAIGAKLLVDIPRRGVAVYGNCRAR